MKILVLTHEYPPLGGGGGRVAKDLALGLAARGHQIHILTDRQPGLPNLEKFSNLTVERLPADRRAPFRAGMGEMLHYNLRAFWRGLALIRRWQPDVIHAHFAVPAGAVAHLLWRSTGKPYVLTAHLGDVPGASPEKTERWFRWIYPFTHPIWTHAAHVVAVSEFTRQLALQHYAIPIQVIHNGVDMASLPSPDPAHPTPQIVFAGRFAEQKNPLDLVQALKQVRDLPWQCAMIGDGPLFDETRSAIEQASLAERIRLPGWTTPEEVLTWFAQADLLALPSRAEGLSVVGVQALAMGLALVLSAVGGNLELVEPGVNGLLVHPGDIAGLAAALRTYLSNPAALQQARVASRKLAQKFDLQTIVQEYELVFTNLAGTSPLKNEKPDRAAG